MGYNIDILEMSIMVQQACLPRRDNVCLLEKKCNSELEFLVNATKTAKEKKYKNRKIKNQK